MIFSGYREGHLFDQESDAVPFMAENGRKDRRHRMGRDAVCYLRQRSIMVKIIKECWQSADFL